MGGGADLIAWQALVEHSGSNSAELLEEAVVVLCGLSGVDEALKAVADAGPGRVRTIGVKALSEYGRHRPELLLDHASQVVSRVREMAAEAVEDDALQQHAALLIGLCGCANG